MSEKELFERAVKAKEYAYVPYSNFRVGAAVLTKDGKIYTGCNVECASFGGTNCAERTAIFKAISEGNRDFEAIAIASDNGAFTFPCGICRQVIFEFGKDIKIIVGDGYGKIKVIPIEELLPYGFSGEDLNK
ncbi:cytidine deaminase [Crassaminicella profunda]|uniref:cytidine deaminase n=1 Tax=Crassaminicella profunda TaxID=1286698 RepID=UPI001CA787AB|nr:cytidine deaminase [Crassaminicella profunda]QZY56557.1 cytidine deaminase [Crassaminicella profunda]